MPQHKKIPTNNPVPYCNIFRPILETQKMRLEEVSLLECRRTHEIKLRSMRSKENDNLYAVFMPVISQMPQFIRKWLKTFMLTHESIMTEKGRSYLSTKKLLYTQWFEAVDDGRKGDVLALYSLSLLTEVHTFVHLHNNQFWSTLKKAPDNHADAIKMCARHLLYLGRGLFVKLSVRQEPLELCPNKNPDIPSIKSGELTLLEQEEYDDILGTTQVYIKTKQQASASTGSAKDLHWVSAELNLTPTTAPLDLSLPTPATTKPGSNPYLPLDLSTHASKTLTLTRLGQMQKVQLSPPVKQNRSVEKSDKLNWKAYVKLTKINLQLGESINLSKKKTDELQSTIPTPSVTLSDIEKATKTKPDVNDSDSSTIIYSWASTPVLFVNDPTD